MGRNYRNAEAVLPPEVLDAVSDALSGRCAFLWIAARRNLSKQRRDRRILRLHARGWSAVRIADHLLVSERTVYRVLARKKALAAPSASAPHRKS